MMNEPHHALAMTYMQNIGTFAKTLRTQAVPQRQHSMELQLELGIQRQSGKTLIATSLPSFRSFA